MDVLDDQVVDLHAAGPVEDVHQTPITGGLAVHGGVADGDVAGVAAGHDTETAQTTRTRPLEIQQTLRRARRGVLGGHDHMHILEKNVRGCGVADLVTADAQRPCPGRAAHATDLDIPHFGISAGDELERGEGAVRVDAGRFDADDIPDHIPVRVPVGRGDGEHVVMGLPIQPGDSATGRGTLDVHAIRPGIEVDVADIPPLHIPQRDRVLPRLGEDGQAVEFQAADATSTEHMRVPPHPRRIAFVPDAADDLHILRNVVHLRHTAVTR
ncbi:hypothetical protein MPMin1_gp56 [Microbacterium phage Min1]|uniref:Uncharacterized protein n=1 Tax=Microbacterium phage Min1 TaxID=446529 RepID=A6N213_9CAUD|nr:hypothetical protein MPMin1_gp56 [Microbacterium phage Min1]ABR10486.1 hypothetical protein [Microbacterium phage Min1]